MRDVKNINKSRVNRSVKRKPKAKSNKGSNKKPEFITIVDYVFLGSLLFSVIFGIQTNTAFLWPFTIMLGITIICMMIIVINAIYSKVFKKIKKRKNKNI